MKNIIAGCLLHLTQFFNRAYLRLNPPPKQGDTSEYLHLTPTTDADKDGVYEKAISHGLIQPDIKNIALTGSYGSGKSSILKSFQLKNPQFKYLNISLANFQQFLQPSTQTQTLAEADGSHKSDIKDKPSADTKNKENAPKTDSSDNESIEYSILQQIFYHVKHKHIPFSRFKRIKNLPANILIPRAILLCIWVLGFIYVIKKEWIPLPHEIRDVLGTSNLRWFRVSGLLYLVIGSVVIIYAVMRIYNNSRFNKLNLSSGEMEISPDKESSILNRHLEEIIYFFEVTNFNVMIIEDLDRFRNPEIFTKLREINTLINNSMQINRKISFIYALKDDIFPDESRTKFFDFIIPVIPVTNSGNSETALTNAIVKMELKKPIPEDLISYLSFYITDMRLLNNIINEFKIYKSQIRSFEVNNASLIATIVYKNKFPTDFSNLHHNKGVIYELFANKENYKKQLSAKLNENRDQLREKITLAEHNYTRSITELRMIYIAQLTFHIEEKYLVNRYNIEFSSAVYLRDLVTDQNFSQLQSQNKINIKEIYNGRTQIDLSFKDLEKIVDKSNSYSSRESALKQVFTYELDSLRKELSIVNDQINKIENFNLSNIIEHGQPIISNTDIFTKDYEILFYLIREGYLNENYAYYMSYFYEGTITQKDLQFYFSIKHRQPLDVNYKLDKIPQLIRKLIINDFNNPEIFNIDLVSYLIAGNDFPMPYIKAIFTQLAILSDTAVNFIEEYMRHGSDKSGFIRALCEHCPEFWNFITHDSFFPTDKKDFYLAYIFNNVPEKRIVLLNKDGQLKEYLSKKTDFLAFTEKLKMSVAFPVLMELGVRFAYLQDPVNEDESHYLKMVYEHSLYEINELMISLMLKHFATNTTSPSLAGNYTSIQESGAEYLIRNIENNLSQYINQVYLSSNDNIQESERMIQLLLNNDKLKEEEKKAFLRKARFTIYHLTHTNPKFWDILLDLNKINFSWENVLAYMNLTANNLTVDNLLKTTLFKYLNSSEIYSGFEEFTTTGDRGNPEIRKMIVQIIETGRLGEYALRHLLNSFPPLEIEPQFGKLSKLLVTTLILTGHIAATSDTLKELNNHHPELIPSIILLNQDKYFSGDIQIHLTAKQINKLLAADELTGENKLLLIQMVSKTDIDSDIDLSRHIRKVYLETSKALEFEKLIAVIKTVREKGLDNVKLVHQSLSYLSEAQIGEALKELGGHYRQIQSGHEEEISGEEVYLPLLEDLKEQGLFVKDIIRREHNMFIIIPL